MCLCDITLEYATELGVFHRDIKPTNIIVHENQAYIIDWGIATSESLDYNGTLSATLAFASMDVLEGVRLMVPTRYSIKDEIESIFYMFVYILYDGGLPSMITDLLDPNYSVMHRRFGEQISNDPVLFHSRRILRDVVWSFEEKGTG